MSEVTPKRKQLHRQLKAMEGELEEKIKQLYLDCLAHNLSVVSCKFLQNLDLYILLEGTQSAPERFLSKEGNSELATKVRVTLNEILNRRLDHTLEKSLNLSASHISMLKPTRSHQLNLLITFDF